MSYKLASSLAASNRPLEWSGLHHLSAAPPQAPCLPLRGSVNLLCDFFHHGSRGYANMLQPFRGILYSSNRRCLRCFSASFSESRYIRSSPNHISPCASAPPPAKSRNHPAPWRAGWRPLNRNSTLPDPQQVAYYALPRNAQVTINPPSALHPQR